MQFRMRLTAMAAAGCAAGLLLAGGTAIASAQTAHPSITGKEVITHSGPETFTQGTHPGEAVALVLRGVVDTHGFIDTGGTARIRPISTRAGALVVEGGKLKIVNKVLNLATCHLQTTVTDHLVVLGHRSTVRFHGASGHGTSIVVFKFFYAHKNGKCDFTHGLNKGGHISVLIEFPALTVH